MKIVLEPGDEEILTAALTRALVSLGLGSQLSQTPKWLTLNEAAERLNISAQTLRWWRNQDKGPLSVKRGRRVYYDSSALDSWMRGADA